MSTSTMRFALIGLSLLLTGCSAPQAPPVAAGDAAAEHRSVRALLYDQGLIEDPEVQVKMSDYVVRMRRDSVRPETGYREFREWLEEWVRANPARARAARARRPPARRDSG